MSEIPDIDLTSLAKRCAEILDWHTTGILTGDEMRRFADFARYGDDALRQLEAKTATEAMRFVIDHFSERQRHAEVMEEVRKEARRQALEEAAILVEAHPMRFAGQNENYVRRSMAESVRALLSRLEER